MFVLGLGFVGLPVFTFSSVFCGLLGCVRVVLGFAGCVRVAFRVVCYASRLFGCVRVFAAGFVCVVGSNDIYIYIYIERERERERETISTFLKIDMMPTSDPKQ